MQWLYLITGVRLRFYHMETKNYFSSGRYSLTTDGFITHLKIKTPNFNIDQNLTAHEIVDLASTLHQHRESLFLNPIDSRFNEKMLFSTELRNIRELCLKKLSLISENKPDKHNGEPFVVIPNNEKYTISDKTIYAYCYGGFFLDKDMNKIGEHEVSTEIAVDILEDILNAD